MKKTIFIFLASAISLISFSQKDTTIKKDSIKQNPKMVCVGDLQSFQLAMFALGNPNDVTPNQTKSILLWISQNLIEEKEYIKKLKKENK